MWKFTPASDSDGHPLLHSLNGNKGRQVWVYDENAGTPEERALVEEARRKFTANRLQQKHSSDELLRWGA
jgi:cycloartenol synthase